MRSRHDLVIVAGGLADHVNNGRSIFIRDQKPANTLPNAEADAALETEHRLDIDGGRVQAGPGSFFDCRQPGQPVRGSDRLWPHPLPQRCGDS